MELKSSPFFRDLGVGMGLRSKYQERIAFDYAAPARPLDWLEVITENLIPHPLSGAPAEFERVVSHLRRDTPIVLHGVSLSIGSTDPLNSDYLTRLKSAIDRYEPEWISDHLCWTGVEGQNIHDLLPLPYTSEAVRHVSDRILRVQDFLGRRILIENLSSYAEASFSEMSEAEFLAAVARRADCGILLDVNNIAVSAFNHGYATSEYLDQVPWERVGQLHLAGHVERRGIRIDTHDHPISDEVWTLYAEVLRRLDRPVSAMLERDDRFPEWSDILSEIYRIREVRESTFVARALTQKGAQSGVARSSSMASPV